MLRGLTSYQVAEMEAYSRIETEPVTKEEREAENLAKIKARFAGMRPVQ